MQGSGTLGTAGNDADAWRKRAEDFGRAYAWMFPGLVLSWLAGGFQSGGWGLLTPVVFAGAAKAHGLNRDMSLWRLSLHRAFSFFGIALGTAIILGVLGAVSLWLVTRWGLEGSAQAAAWSLCFTALSWWPLSRLWLAPALPFVVGEEDGAETFFTRLWSGPGLRASFLWTADGGPLRNGLPARALIYMTLVIYVLAPTRSPDGSALPLVAAFAMCFGLMPLTVHVWVCCAHRVHRAVMVDAAPRRDESVSLGGLAGPTASDGWIDAALPLEQVEPGAWLHAIRDFRAAGAGPPFCLILKGRRGDEQSAARALVSEGQRHWGYVFRVVDFAPRRAAAPPRWAPPWEAGLGDGLLLLHAPARYAQARFYVAAAGGPRELEAGGALREAFRASACSALLVEIAYIGTCELGVAERVRHESGSLVRIA